MKFSDLSNTQRSLLAALASANNSVLHTGQLAGYTGRCAQKAAHQLCSLRDLGLVFSHQKKDGEQYCRWQITAIGMAVYTGRPDGDVVVTQPSTDTAAAAPAAKVYQIHQTGYDGAVRAVTTSSIDVALEALSEVAAANPGEEFRLITTVAVAHLPKPKPSITRV